MPFGRRATKWEMQDVTTQPIATARLLLTAMRGELNNEEKRTVLVVHHANADLAGR